MRERRRERGLSQERLANQAGVTLSAIQRLEAGQVSDPHYSTLTGIAHALGTTVAELVGEKELVPLVEAPREAGHLLLERALDAARQDADKERKTINRLAASEGTVESDSVSKYTEDEFRAELRALGFPDDYFEDFIWPLVTELHQTRQKAARVEEELSRLMTDLSKTRA